MSWGAIQPTRNIKCETLAVTRLLNNVQHIPVIYLNTSFGKRINIFSFFVMLQNVNTCKTPGHQKKAYKFTFYFLNSESITWTWIFEVTVKSGILYNVNFTYIFMACIHLVYSYFRYFPLHPESNYVVKTDKKMFRKKKCFPVKSFLLIFTLLYSGNLNIYALIWLKGKYVMDSIKSILFAFAMRQDWSSEIT